MKINENDVSAIVKQVVAKLNLTEPKSENGLFEDMNEAIAAAKAAQQIVTKMPQKDDRKRRNPRAYGRRRDGYG